jgi:hypothetical protein
MFLPLTHNHALKEMLQIQDVAGVCLLHGMFT